jgi:NADPH2:quinone reductase
MRAAVITSTDAPPAAAEFDEPTPGDGHVVVSVRIAGLNPVDLYKARGQLGTPPLPSVAGSEGIADLDGRRVYFSGPLAPHGSMAERTLIDPHRSFDVPDGIDDDVAVGLGIAGLAGWLPFAHHAPLLGGERVLVLGATGIAGSIAVQAAKLHGAGHVVAAGRHAESLEPLLQRGADETLVLGDDLDEALARAAGDGFDVIADYVYGEIGAAALRHTADHATHVVAGGSAGQEAPIAFRTLQGRRLIGHANWHVPLDVRRDAYTALATHARDGQLRIETRRYGLEEIGAAWEAQASSPHRKLVIDPR